MASVFRRGDPLHGFISTSTQRLIQRYSRNGNHNRRIARTRRIIGRSRLLDQESERLERVGLIPGIPRASPPPPHLRPVHPCASSSSSREEGVKEGKGRHEDEKDAGGRSLSSKISARHFEPADAALIAWLAIAQLRSTADRATSRNRGLARGFGVIVIVRMGGAGQMPRSMTSCNGLIAKKVAGPRRLRAAAIISPASSLDDPDDDLDLRRTPVISSFLEAADRLIYILPSTAPSPRRSRARASHIHGSGESQIRRSFFTRSHV
jgi:hypothetical protein